MPSAQPQWSPTQQARAGRPADLLYALPQLTFGFNDGLHNPPPPLYVAAQQTRRAADCILRQGDVRLKVDHMILPAISRTLDVGTPTSYPRPAQLDAPFLRRWDAWLATLKTDLRGGDGSDHVLTTTVIAEVVRLANAFLSTRFVPKVKQTQWERHPEWDDLHLLPSAVGLLIWTNAGADTGWERLLATLGSSSIKIQRRAGVLHTKPYSYSQELRDVLAEVLFTMHAHRLVYLVITSGPATAVFEMEEDTLGVSPLLTWARRGPNLLTLMVGLALMLPLPTPHFVDLRPIGIKTQWMDWRSPPLTIMSSSVAPSAIPPLPPLPMAPPPPPPATSPPKTPDRVHLTPIPSAPNSKNCSRFHSSPYLPEPGSPSPSTPTFNLSHLTLGTSSGGSRKRRRQARPSVSAPDLPYLPGLSGKFIPSSTCNPFDTSSPAASQSYGHRPTASYPSVPFEGFAASTASRGHRQMPSYPTLFPDAPRTPRTPHHTPGSSSSSSRMSMPRTYRGFPGGEVYDPAPPSPTFPATDDEEEPAEMLAPSPPDHHRNDEGRMATPPRAQLGTQSTPPSRGVAPPEIGTSPVTNYTLKRLREPTPPEPAWDIPTYGSLTLGVDPQLAQVERTELLYHATVSSYLALSKAKASRHLHLTLTWMNTQSPRWREFDADLPAGDPGPNRPLPVTVKLFSPDFPPQGLENIAEWEEEEAIEDGAKAEEGHREPFVGFFKSAGEVRVYALVVVDMARLTLGDAR